VEHAFVLDFRSIRRSRWKVLPDTAAHLLVHLEPRGGRLTPRRLVLVGARTRAIETDVSSRAWTVGVRLRPGALPALTGLPAHDLTDRAVRATEVWGRRADVFHERAAGEAERGPVAVRGVLLGVLEEWARPSRGVSWVARALARDLAPRGRSGRICDLANGLGLASRTLRARSNAEVGLSPKRFARIQRLFHAIEASRGSQRWSEIAADCGFSDQPHLVREFRALLGESPSTFVARAS
jgi:AraC-like DNA-binding protein